MDQSSLLDSVPTRHTLYRDNHLFVNGVEILTMARLYTIHEHPLVYSNCRDIDSMLSSGIDRSVKIAEVDRMEVVKQASPLRFQKDGYKNVRIITKAINLVNSALSCASSIDPEWAAFFDTEIWSEFELKSLFSFT